MSDESVARRYAAAYFQQAQSAGTLDTAFTDLQSVGAAITANPKLVTFLAQPLVPAEKKKELLKAAFVPGVSEATVSLLGLLVDKRRIDLLGSVIEEFVRQVREARNVVSATATTAVPLTAEQQTALVTSLEARTGKKIELATEVEPAVLGGIRVRIGDTVLDGTVQGNLDRLRDQLLVRR